jgi:hypothetical protein
MMISLVLTNTDYCITSGFQINSDIRLKESFGDVNREFMSPNSMRVRLLTLMYEKSI